MEIVSTYIILLVAVTTTIIFGLLLYVLRGKNHRILSLQNSIGKLKHSFDDLDEQAKLIVKTDLELNKAQEELDKRLNGLDALQKISRLISTTLDEGEIYRRLNQTVKTTLGFEKILIIMYEESQTLKVRVALGFSQEDVDYVLSNFQKDAQLMVTLNEGNNFSSINAPRQRIESIVQLFSADHFVLTPILTQNGTIGVTFFGNHSNVLPITEGDEEVVSILANQIGQSLENARLFEEVFRSSQDLELKIQDRTQQLESALNEVQNISKTKSEFISAVSHELRTPLTSIKGYASLLMTGKLGDIPEQVKQRLEKINNHSDNLVKLINDLLDISRIESGGVEMSFSKCHITQMIENVHDLLTPQMREKDILWQAEVDSNIPEMILDTSQFERVFINLVSNAVKFTPERGTISVRAMLDNDKVNFEVADTGIGISEEDVAKLFDEFFRVENEINASVKGTGLGLPLAKKIVEAYGGKMWITSKIGLGTTFHFVIPLKRENEEEVASRK